MPIPNHTTVDAADTSATETSPGETETPTIIEFTVPTEAFVLAEPLRAFPDIMVKFEQLVPANHTPMPYLWTNDGETPAFCDALEADPRVEACRKAAVFHEGALYRFEWSWSDGSLLGWLANSHEDVALLQAEGQADEWTLRLRLPSRELLSEFQAEYQEWGCDLRVMRLYDLTDPKLGRYDITEKQREALVCALQMGYFEIPREATLADVGEVLGISPKSVSERLRRAQTNFVSNALAIGQPTGVGLDEQ